MSADAYKSWREKLEDFLVERLSQADFKEATDLISRALDEEASACLQDL